MFLGDCMFDVDNKFSGANIPRTVRFTDNLYERLNITAQRNNISFNLLVLQCCKYALDNENSEGKDNNENDK